MIEGVVFGPFKSEHQLATVDAHFRAAAYTCLESHVLSKFESAFTRIKGGIGGYDDPKYFGPNSLIKYRYFFGLHVFAPGVVEHANGILDYNPDSREMRLYRATVESLEFQKQRIIEKAYLTAVMWKAARGDSDIQCPYCRERISVYRHGKKMAHLACNGCRKIRVIFD
ncbi:MAG: hypothetical protein KIS92_23275 [Planctomycetota bacterium]|nr:hypothetical protein [Planctomycetota bacterium]